jgi:hypothetical protein
VAIPVGDDEDSKTEKPQDEIPLSYEGQLPA